jgi:signal transduction histidine kinase
MSQYLSFYFASTALILFAMLISGIQLSKGVERNQSFYFMSFANLIGFLGTGVVVIAFVSFGHNLDPYRFFEELPDSAFKRIFFIGYLLFGLSMLCQPLYFRALRQRVSKKYILASLGCLILFFIIVILVGKSGNYLYRSFFVYIFILCLLSWILFEATSSNKQFPTIWFNLIRSTSVTFIGIFMIWMAIIFVTNRQGYILGFSLHDVSQFDISSRVLRGSLFVFLQLLILMHWMENFSHNAIKVKARDKQIQDLLLEKDVLIENLSNKNALVETGALSAGLAHEFNQFLARIELNSGEVLDKINRPDVNLEELKFSMGNILKANQSAANLIISLKKLFQSGKDVALLVNFDALVEEVASLYVDRARKSGVLIKLDLQANEPIIVWDSLMRQVVANLISNAVDSLDLMARSNKVICIKSEIVEKRWYRFSVTDNGFGVKPEYVDKLFSLFVSSKSSGTGVGLWLSRHIIERHQGSLTYQNLPENGGASFIATIPMGAKFDLG